MILQNQNSQRHIYLVDDDDDDRVMFAEVLLELNSSLILTQAENGEQLMNILSIPPNPLPDLIFLDLNMPKKNGFECLEEIRNCNEALKKLSIVILTTSNDVANRNKAFELGATFYAVKPTTFNDLKLLMNDILQMDWVPSIHA